MALSDSKAKIIRVKVWLEFVDTDGQRKTHIVHMNEDNISSLETRFAFEEGLHSEALTLSATSRRK